MPEMDVKQKNILDHLHDGVFMVSRDLRITYWNKSARRLTGYTAYEMIGCYCWDNTFIHIDEHGRKHCEIYCPLRQVIDLGKDCEIDMFLRQKSGYRLPVSVRAAPVNNGDQSIVGAVEIFSDNSTKLQMLDEISQLKQLAMYDQLTELVNRRYLEDYLEALFDEYRRYKQIFGVLFVDIDDFKSINDNFGHAIGDQVLHLVAKTLENNVRGSDVVGRWGGEEFIAVIRNIDPGSLYRLAQKLCRLVREQVSSRLPSDLRVTISVGGAVLRDDDDMYKLINRADQRMYQAKAGGRNCVCLEI